MASAPLEKRSAARCFALVPCAGVGARAGGDIPKQYQSVAGRALVWHTLHALAGVSRIDATLVVLSADDAHFDTLVDLPSVPLWVARRGGATRAQTVAQGLAVLRERGVRDDDWVLVHDAARCLIQPAWVDRLIDACQGDAVGGLLALPLADTLKQAQGDRVVQTVSRVDKWAAQTPQMFPLGLLQQALSAADDTVTDEASAIEQLGLAPRLVRGDLCNIKVTWPEDFDLARRWIEASPGVRAA